MAIGRCSSNEVLVNRSHCALPTGFVSMETFGLLLNWSKPWRVSMITSPSIGAFSLLAVFSTKSGTMLVSFPLSSLMGRPKANFASAKPACTKARRATSLVRYSRTIAVSLMDTPPGLKYFVNGFRPPAVSSLAVWLAESVRPSESVPRPVVSGAAAGFAGCW